MSRATIDTILAALGRREPIETPVAVVVAHPDDETVGAGSSLHLFRRLVLVHVTDGAPRNLQDARAAGFSSCEAYAASRRLELQAALRIGSVRTFGGMDARPEVTVAGPALSSDPVMADAGAPSTTFRTPAPQIVDGAPRRATTWRYTRDNPVTPLVSGPRPHNDGEHGAPPGLPIPDQTASLRLPWLGRELRRRLEGIAAVLTHPYEGGHPDHDAVAFAVQATGLPVIEMAGYHAAPDGGIEVGHFLPGGVETTVPLNNNERNRRDSMLACFATQRATLAPFFGIEVERFRAAPRYDFTRPPAPRVYYEGFDWGMTSARWCSLAAAALRC
jgi:LmbE family N-acetylglucosaminyl deacetylase